MQLGQEVVTECVAASWYRTQVLERRNVKFAKRVVRELKRSGGSKLFVLGVSHLLGNASVVERVRQAGFTVDRMEEGEIPSQGYQSAGGRVTNNIILALAVLLLNIDL